MLSACLRKCWGPKPKACEHSVDSILCTEVKSGFSVVPDNETGRKLHTAFHLSLPIQEKTNSSSVAHPGFLGNDASGQAACKVPWR